ncbi:MAG: hypothetical protein VXZ96_06795 [Myxococcota bacterium]|nr:hypothetical protein [Myxococcota bacterium]
MKACHSCGTPLHHPNTGHTVICPSCGSLFDFKNPDTPPHMEQESTPTLPNSPLKSRARWIAIVAAVCFVGLMYAVSKNPPLADPTTEQRP